MIGVESFDMLELRDKSRKFAIEGHKVCCFYFLKDKIDMLLEVPGVDLH